MLGTIRNAYPQRPSGDLGMKPKGGYLKYVRWEESDRLYVGYCPDLFPWGGVCHGITEEETYRDLGTHLQAEVDERHRSGQELRPVSTRPMRDACLA